MKIYFVIMYAHARARKQTYGNANIDIDFDSGNRNFQTIDYGDCNLKTDSRTSIPHALTTVFKSTC